MFAKAQLTELAERRRLLVMEADLHRSFIGLERARLRERLSGFQAAGGRLATGGPFLMAGTALAGVLAVRHWRKIIRWMPTVWTAVRWVRSLGGK